MKYHGLYCGPNWSDGKKQLSVAYGAPAVDALDQLCKEHDAAYANSNDTRELLNADKEFARRAITLGWPKSIVAGIAVGGQAMFRALDLIITKHPTKTNMVSKAMKAHQNFMQKKLPAPSPAPKMYREVLPSKKNTQTTQSAVPSAYTITSYTGKPSTTSTRDGGVVLKHRGLIAGFIGSTTFTAQNFQINPALAGVFPWCSQLARSYDKYRFKKLKFEFRSVVPTTTAGVVMMSFDYDTLDTLPVSKFEHAQTTPNVESNSFNSFELKVQCDNQYRFCRQGSITGVDLKTYDFGQLVISSSYGAAALVGEIYVDYEVELSKPSHGSPIFANIAASGSKTAPLTTTSISGMAPPCRVSGTTGLVFDRPGEYFILVYIAGTVLSVGNPPSFVGTASAGAVCTAASSIVVDAAATTAVATFRCRVGAGDTLLMTPIVTSTTWTSTGIRIMEVEYSYA